LAEAIVRSRELRNADAANILKAVAAAVFDALVVLLDESAGTFAARELDRFPDTSSVLG
jgi:hypothetical protein